MKKIFVAGILALTIGVSSASACGTSECVRPSAYVSGPAVEQTVKREYYVTETKQVWQPVVVYRNAGTYQVTRKVCTENTCK